MKYDPHRDQLVGHAGPGLSKGWPDYELEEIELGGRVATALNDPDQWWWEIHSEEVKKWLGT